MNGTFLIGNEQSTDTSNESVAHNDIMNMNRRCTDGLNEQIAEDDIMNENK